MNRFRLYFILVFLCVYAVLIEADLDIQIGYDPKAEWHNREWLERKLRNAHDHWIDGQWQVEANYDHVMTWELQKLFMGWQ